MTPTKPIYSVVVAIYNDGYLARDFCEEIKQVFATIAGTMELIFINDGSADDSLVQLQALLPQYGFVRVIDLSRNFGQHSALACGFAQARGDIIIRLNVDMQDPPSEIPKLLAVMHAEDADLVVGQYEQRKGPWTTRLTSFLYFGAFRWLSGLEVPHNSSAMRVMSRRFINAYNTLTEKSRFPQGLDQYLGFKQRLVEIEHRVRADGKSSYTLRKRLYLALDGILYFSDRPVKLMVAFGFIVAIMGFVLGALLLVSRLLGADYLPGYTSLAALGLFTFGIQLSSLGLVGLYVGKIFREVQNRPLYLIREVYTGKGGVHA